MNLGSAKRLSMATLQAAFADSGYADARTVLQSGNVVFSSPKPLGDTDVKRLEAAVERRSGVRSRMLVLHASELQQVVAENALVSLATDHSRLQVSFVNPRVDPRSVPAPEPRSIVPDVLHVGSRAVYHWAPNGQMQSRVPPAYWRAFGDAVTARNWRTVSRLLELATS